MREGSSPTNSIPQLLARVRALAQRPARDREGTCWIEGVRNFVQAYDARLPFETIVSSSILLKSDLADMLARRLAARGVRRVRVTPAQFRSVCVCRRASGIGAIVRQHWKALEQIDATRGLCWLVIERIRSPGNLGTIVRTAEACGAGGIIFVGPACDPFDPVVVRACMGGLFHLALVRSTPEALRLWARRNAVQLIGLAPDADRPWTKMPIHMATGIVIGEERVGLTTQLRDLCDATVRLPMAGRADSLNVGVAAGVVMYELVRRGLPQEGIASVGLHGQAHSMEGEAQRREKTH